MINKLEKAIGRVQSRVWIVGLVFMLASCFGEDNLPVRDWSPDVTHRGSGSAQGSEQSDASRNQQVDSVAIGQARGQDIDEGGTDVGGEGGTIDANIQVPNVKLCRFDYRLKSSVLRAVDGVVAVAYGLADQGNHRLPHSPIDLREEILGNGRILDLGNLATIPPGKYLVAFCDVKVNPSCMLDSLQRIKSATAQWFNFAQSAIPYWNSDWRKNFMNGATSLAQMHDLPSPSLYATILLGSIRTNYVQPDGRDYRTYAPYEAYAVTDAVSDFGDNFGTDRPTFNGIGGYTGSVHSTPGLVGLIPKLNLGGENLGLANLAVFRLSKTSSELDQAGVCDGRNTSPLVISMDGAPFTMTAPTSVQFDLDADGHAELTGWLANPNHAFLAFDRNGNGTIDDGTELFGDKTAPGATNGFAALSLYDSNGDRRIDSQDAIWQWLRLWFDRNLNGRTDHGELQFASAAIDQINLQYQSQRRTDIHGNFIDQHSWVRLSNSPARRPLADIWFTRHR